MKLRQVNPSEYTSKKTQKVPTPSPGCNAGTSSDLTCACRVCRYFLIRPKTYDAGASSNEKKEIFSLIAAADPINPINEINETYFCTRCRFYCFFSNSWVYFLYRWFYKSLFVNRYWLELRIFKCRISAVFMSCFYPTVRMSTQNALRQGYEIKKSIIRRYLAL